MAELNSEDHTNPDLLWTVSHLLSLGIVQRFARNYNRYRETTLQRPDRDTLLDICYEIEHKVYAFENIRAATPKGASREPAISSLLLRQQIYERFEHLHHLLLYYAHNSIESIIPLLDAQLKLWHPENREYTIQSSDLSQTACSLSRIEMKIQDNLSAA